MTYPKLNMYCIAVEESDLKLIKDLGYIPVGLGNKSFTSEWYRDNTGNNISNKNKWYSEFTFHYWIWKNKLIHKNNNDWEGFCAYRDFWGDEEQYKIYLKDKINYDKLNTNNYQNIQNLVINNIPKKWI